MEDQDTSTQRVQITLQHPHRLLACAWAALGLLLIVTFFIPNYGMAVLQMNGVDTLRMSFKDTDHLRKLFDDASYFLMVSVPIGYLLLGIGCTAAAVLLWLHKGRKWVPPLAGASLVLLVLTIVGLFVIGSNSSAVPWIGKLVPKPIYGYHLAMMAQGLICATGIMYWVLQGRRSAH